MKTDLSAESVAKPVAYFYQHLIDPDCSIPTIRPQQVPAWVLHSNRWLLYYTRRKFAEVVAQRLKDKDKTKTPLNQDGTLL